MSITEVAGLYAQCYTEGRKKVTAAVFLRVAEARSLFSRAMSLSPLPLLATISPENRGSASLPQNPHPSRPSSTNSLLNISTSQMAAPLLDTNDDNVRTLRARLGALVHRKMVQVKPSILRMIRSIPERWKMMILEAIQLVEDSLEESSVQGKKSRKKNSGAGKGAGAEASAADQKQATNQLLWAIDGIQPFVAYRRLLAISLAAKAFSDNPLLPSEILGYNYNSTSYSQISKLKIHNVEVVLDGLEEVRQS